MKYANNKFYQDLRSMDLSYMANETNNRYLQLWSTNPSKRFERVKKMKEISFIKRSGFNKVIDLKDNSSYINKPISSKKLSLTSLKK